LFKSEWAIFCPKCGTKIAKITSNEIAEAIIKKFKKYKKGKSAQKRIGQIIIFAPVVRGRKGEHCQMLGAGFAKVRVDKKIKNLSQKIVLDIKKRHTIELIVDILYCLDMPQSIKAKKGKNKLQRLIMAIT